MLFSISAGASAQTGADSLLDAINIVRASYGLTPVTMSPQLGAAAQGMAADMAATHTFGHVTADGRTLDDRVAPTGYIATHPTWALSENLAWEDAGLSTTANVMSGWLASPAHREVLLDPDIREVGIGLATGTPAGMDGPGTYYVADFAAPPAGSAESAAPAPRAPARARRHPRHTQRSRPTHAQSMRGRKA